MLLNPNKKTSNLLWLLGAVCIIGYLVAWVVGARDGVWFLPLIGFVAIAVAFKVPDDDDE